MRKSFIRECTHAINTLAQTPRAVLRFGHISSAENHPSDRNHKLKKKNLVREMQKPIITQIIYIFSRNSIQK